MDDLRNRYRMPRRDYSGAGRSHPAPRSVDTNQPMFGPAAPKPQPVHHRPPDPPATHHQPVPQPQPVTHPAHPVAARRQTRKRRRPFLKVLILLLLLAGLVASGAYGYQTFRTKNPFPQSVQQSKLDKLYPNKLPDGYTIDERNISYSNGVLIYDATDSNNHRLVFTLQATPPTFDFNAFYKQQMTDIHRYDTQFGKAIIGKNSSRWLGSLVDGDTWLLLSTNSTAVSVNDMALVLKNLKHY